MISSDPLQWGMVAMGVMVVIPLILIMVRLLRYGSFTGVLLGGRFKEAGKIRVMVLGRNHRTLGVGVLRRRGASPVIVLTEVVRCFGLKVMGWVLLSPSQLLQQLSSLKERMDLTTSVTDREERFLAFTFTGMENKNLIWVFPCNQAGELIRLLDQSARLAVSPP
ncbi:MAG: hypothetical protein HQL84_03235 [Magnetococcales bacterium]|nr:hypothetical protein [Magnetococcales bacterium]MBF0149040.1 hypothetical protein [Magnetococcales bacterium]MBF0172089.1 hypothetical protein [Magnetococcales bacterium]MBF0346201.1 hypothetical protein [Magnetococcales bacterium]MBF0630306.1 hypothetical protein [Magnetococcales bacterium]